MIKGNAPHDKLEESIEIRLKDREILLVGSVPLLIGLIALVNPGLINPDNPLWAMRVVGGAFLLGGIVVMLHLKRSYRVKADSKSIMWHESKNQRCAEWRNISRVEIKYDANRGIKGSYILLRIVGIKEDVIVAISLRDSDLKSEGEFLKFIHSKTQVIDGRSGVRDR